ncbi:MAG: PAS domain-containing protein [Gemmatimonadota bacterium]|nr:PAS domain-containing protein [Gemmatimonadota bacterium]
MRKFAHFTLDSSGLITGWCPGASKTTRFRGEEVSGRSHSLFYTEEDQQSGKPDRLLDTAMEQGHVEDMGVRMRGDGTRFIAYMTIHRLDGGSGAPVFAMEMTDLTVDPETENMVRHPDRLLKGSPAFIGLGGWEWDIVADTLTWTPEIYQLFGVNPEEYPVTGISSYLSFIHPDDRERVVTVIGEAYRTGGWFDHEERIVRSDGRERVLRTRGHAIAEEGGIILRMAGSCIDITEFREAHEKELELTRARTARMTAENFARSLRFLVRVSELLVASLDLEAALMEVAWLVVSEIADWCAVDLIGSDGVIHRLVTADPDMERLALSERYRKEFRPGGPIDLVVQSGKMEVWHQLTDSQTQRIVRSPRELEVLREFRFDAMAVVPLQGRRGPIGALTLAQSESGRVFSEDDIWIARELARHIALAIENAGLHKEIEERSAALEEQTIALKARTEELQAHALQIRTVVAELEAVNLALRQRTIEAEEANRAKAEFLAMMSHELRTPLNAIVGYTDLLDLGLHGPITSTQRETLARIRHNQRSLLALINDVLHFAKLEAGHINLKITPVPIGEIIRDLDVVIEPQMRTKGLRYTYRLCTGDPSVLGDQERIEQILLNLLTNAIKFTARGGAISVAVEVEPAVVRFHISDTGCGIPSDRLDSIFDPFIQINRVPEELRERGVGLGLAISRDLAQAMGGSVSVVSQLKGGSTFTLTLPRGDDIVVGSGEGGTETVPVRAPAPEGNG